ncbi:PolC-type DNA polymerase III [Hathewaya massiliensis]|uniref:PolC-type DNA polymerase III n=1 Tax=Hathewaya massiliensis TaxID=1964382 RepID=UPI0011590A36|nr:PolC-type DNA polymerase III [Hathewaya massiliensis]
MDIVQVLKENLREDDFLKLKDFKFLKVQYYKAFNKLKLILKGKNSLESNLQENIKNILKDFFQCFDDIEIMLYKDISDITLEEVSRQYWIELVQNISETIPLCKECLLNSKKVIDGENLNIYYGNSFVCKFLKEKDIEKTLKTHIKEIFGLQCEVYLEYIEELNDDSYFNKKEKENFMLLKEALDNKPSLVNKNIHTKQEYKKTQTLSKENDVSNQILGKNINEEPIAISEVNLDLDKACIEGDLFKLEIKETKTGKILFVFNLTDYTSSITLKCFPNKNSIDKMKEELKVGEHYKIKGDIRYDKFINENIIFAQDIIKLEKIEKLDLCEEKRVELHLHTNMSAMDGITPTKKLVERAAKWGHKAIAITDHGVAQAFPEAMDASKKYNIKVIYGVEAYLVDDGTPIIIGGENRTIEDEFIVFDIETTGFSSENDKIIEIGAVKIKEGVIIDNFNNFVNPKISIPYNITELTGITNDMVRSEDGIEIVLPKFLDFIKDSVLVAHNASFDTSFIKKNCRDLNLKLNNPIMDTIPLSKFLYPELKRFKLNVVAKHLNISLENHHRAVDDAKATGEILIKSFEKLRENEILTMKELNKAFLNNFNVKSANTNHLIILCKNQIGLKNLYKLISFSNLDHFHKKPRMPKSLIEQYREGLIIGSACEAGQVYREILNGKTYEEIKDIIEFYDYLEIQPIGNNKFLIENGNVKDEEELKSINRKICEIGRKSNLPVVATGDVHFLDPKDEIYRRILMAGQGFNDADNQPPLYFKTTEEMLKEFSYLGEELCKEVVITTPNLIADSIENVKPIPEETFTPKIEGSEEEIRNMTMEKAYSIYGSPLPEVVQKRLDKELNSIINNGYAVLYLIAHKLVAKSINDGYLVGSRGSVGSSFVATMCDITEVNGLPPHYVCGKCKYNEFILDGSVGSGVDMEDKNCPKCGQLLHKDGFDIPFETFLGFEGDKEPDIDLNFSGDNQGEIHKYTEVLFGEGHTFKAGTIGTIADKTAYGFVKKYLEERGKKVTNAEIERLTVGCTGVKRTTGQHPGGIMVVPSDNEIFNFCPIQHPADDSQSDIITTHFDYHSISGRLLKLDILGHDDPTVLRMLKDITGVDPKSVPLDDEAVLSLFTSTEALGISKEDLGCEVGTYGLPEFGTKFVRQMLLDTSPKTFSDLVRISGLSHGTDVWINNAQYYIKEGYTTLKDCIATRDDIMVYLIYKGLPPKIAFTIMEKVRKGKGLTEEHENIMKEHDVPNWYIESCKKIKYMFPKGHAVAYVMMAIRIAYFKVHYPRAYYASYLTVRGNDFDGELIIKGEEVILNKMNELYAEGNNISVKDKGLLTTLEICYEMYKRGIKFLPTDIYKSDSTKFTLEGDSIRMPLSALQGVGKNAAKSIENSRKDGEFISKEDLRNRAKVTKTVIEALDKHGCLKNLPDTNQLSFFTGEIGIIQKFST